MAWSTLEVRWFFPGPLEESGSGMEAWFRTRPRYGGSGQPASIGWQPAPPAWRQDRYLLVTGSSEVELDPPALGAPIVESARDDGPPRLAKLDGDIVVDNGTTYLYYKNLANQYVYGARSSSGAPWAQSRFPAPRRGR